MRDRSVVVLASVLSLVAGCSSSGGGGDDREDGTIGPAGGTVSVAGGPTVQIPAGALSVNTPIALSTSPVQPPAGAITAIYEFAPAETTFARPALVSFPVPAGSSETDVAIYWRKAGSAGWEVLPTSVTGTTATAATTRFGAGFVGAACAAGTACTPADPCRGAAMTCDQGTPVCSSTGPDLPDGTLCGGGKLCASGTCAPSYAGPITVARTYAVTPPASAPYIETDEVSWYAPPVVERTVINGNVPGYQVRTLAFEGRAVLMGANTRYDPDGTQIAVSSFDPPQLILPPSFEPGTRASSTSTVTGGPVPYTLTRNVVVNGLETITVPAGTFSALKTTSTISPSNGGASLVVTWWATEVGIVRSVSYPDTNPSVTFVSELIRFGPMVCSGTACACNAVELSAPDVQPTYVAAEPPAPQGGDLVAGTYHLTAEHEYTGSGGATGPTGETHREVYVVDAGGTIQFASVHPDSAAGGDRGTVAYERSGNELIVSPLCGRGPAEGERVGFTATPDELRLISPAEPGSPSQGQVKVLTRQ